MAVGDFLASADIKSFWSHIGRAAFIDLALFYNWFSIQKIVHGKMFTVAASCNNECLWLINYLL